MDLRMHGARVLAVRDGYPRPVIHRYRSEGPRATKKLVGGQEARGTLSEHTPPSSEANYRVGTVGLLR